MSQVEEATKAGAYSTALNNFLDKAGGRAQTAAMLSTARPPRARESAESAARFRGPVTPSDRA